MKTILSLTALATLLGLLPFALADAKSTKAAKLAKPTAASVKADPTADPAASPTPKTPAAKTAKSTNRATGAKIVAASEAKSAKDKSAKVSSAASPAAGSVAVQAPAKKADLTPTQEDKLLVLLNEGTVEELSAIPGIASTRADSIVSARPFASIHEIILVEGVGNATFEKILAFGKGLTRSRSSQASGTRNS